MFRPRYSPSDWYWRVGEAIFSSRAAAYVQPDAPAYVAWVAKGNRPSRIAGEAELWAVLAVQYPAGLPATEAAQDVRRDHELSASDLVAFKIAFNHENRLRALEGRPSITAGQFRAAVKALL